MLTQEQIRKEAEYLQEAENNKQQIEATTTRFPEMDIEDAYAIQKAWIQLQLTNGRKIIGHKIGLTSKVMQVAMGINEPDYGTILDTMLFKNTAKINTADFLDPRIEVELAFVLKDDLAGEHLTVSDVLSATDYVVPALELIAARSYREHPLTGYKRTVKDTISDNAANAGIILGDIKIHPKDVDLRWVSTLLYKNNIIEESGVAAAVLEHPAKGVAWLAKKYAAHKIALKANHIVLSGSFTRPIKVGPGDTIVADYNTFGKIECQFM